MQTSAQNNAFVEMSPTARIALAVYWLFWQILPEIVFAVRNEAGGEAAFAMSVLCRVLTDAILLAPILLSNIGNTRTGWTHPLILPGLFAIALSLVRDANHVLEPFLMWFAPAETPTYAILYRSHISDIHAVELKRDFLILLSTVFYYAGFIIFRPKRAARLEARSQSHQQIAVGVYLAALGVCFFAFAIFLAQNGGIIQHMSSLAYGRFAMRESVGHWLVVIKFTPYILILWYLHRPKILWTPLFIVAFTVTLGMQFAATGGRAAMLLPVAIMMAAWVMVNRRVPVASALLATAAVALFLGTLGEIRNSSHRNEGIIDFSSIMETDLLQRLEDTRAESQRRQELSGVIAIVAKVPDQAPYLYGLSYVSAAAFFIPRSLWRDKPRGAGAYVNGMLFNNLSKEQMTSFQGAGFPAGGVGEAYFNFGVVGVILVFSLFGAFHKWMVYWALDRRRSPDRKLIYLLSVMLILTPASIEIVSFLQIIVLVWLVSLFSRLFSQTKASAFGYAGGRNAESLARSQFTPPNP